MLGHNPHIDIPPVETSDQADQADSWMDGRGLFGQTDNKIGQVSPPGLFCPNQVILGSFLFLCNGRGLVASFPDRPDRKTGIVRVLFAPSDNVSVNSLCWSGCLVLRVSDSRQGSEHLVSHQPSPFIGTSDAHAVLTAVLAPSSHWRRQTPAVLQSGGLS